MPYQVVHIAQPNKTLEHLPCNAGSSSGTFCSRTHGVTAHKMRALVFRYKGMILPPPGTNTISASPSLTTSVATLSHLIMADYSCFRDQVVVITGKLNITVSKWMWWNMTATSRRHSWWPKHVCPIWKKVKDRSSTCQAFLDQDR